MNENDESVLADTDDFVRCFVKQVTRGVAKTQISTEKSKVKILRSNSSVKK